MEDKFVKDLSLFTSTMVVIPVIALLVLSLEGEFDVDPMASSRRHLLRWKLHREQKRELYC